jgi:chemotaxis signal transduction protein
MIEGRDLDVEEVPAAVNVQEVFVFRVGRSLYALDKAHVHHVAEVGRILPVPMLPPHFLGVVHERGRLVPAIDLAILSGLPDDREDAYRRMVTLEAEGTLVAVLADELLGLREVPVDAIVPPTRPEDVAQGEFADARGTVTLLRAAGVLERLRSPARAS